MSTDRKWKHKSVPTKGLRAIRLRVLDCDTANTYSSCPLTGNLCRASFNAEPEVIMSQNRMQ
eukprot:scaffold13464_cov17-Tisochrysis_lutea.AAC.2